MKTFKKFILEQLHQQILLEMPYVKDGDKIIDLELELRVPRLPDLLYEELVHYLNLWYMGYSFLPKVKDYWTDPTGKLNTDIKISPKGRFDSFKGYIHYKFDGTHVYKLVPNPTFPKKPTEIPEVPKKLETETEKEIFLRDLVEKLKPTYLTAFGKNSPEDIKKFIEDIKNPSNILSRI